MRTFSEAYKEWFVMKCKTNKKSTVDRLEVCFNRYYHGTDFIEMCISKITEKDIIQFYQRTITMYGTISPKEFERIHQIMRGVLVYMRDMEYKGIRLYDWDLIKRNVPQNKIIREKKVERALSKSDVQKLLDAVIHERIYPLKQSTCLCLCMNFYLGLRIGELSALRFTDFDLQNLTLTVSKTDSKSYDRDENGEKIGTMTYEETSTKTVNAVRVIPLLPEIVYIYELIKNHHEISGYHSPFLVYDGTDTIRLRSLDRTLRRLCDLCGIPAFNSHKIRKTFASMLHHHNVPTRAIADLMGHSEVSTTENNYILSFANSQDTYRLYMRDSLKYN